MSLAISSCLLAVGIAQADTTYIRDRPCAGCQVVLDTVAIIGDRDGPGLIYGGAAVYRDARRRYLIVHGGAPSRLTVFDSTGRFLRTVGGSGGGPGEYLRIWRVFPVAGGLIIHDDMARRATELDLEFRVRRTYHMETVPRNALLGPRGDGIVAATIPTSTRVGFPLHAVDSIGNVTRSFGYDGRPFREDMVSLFRRGLAPVAGTRTFWAHHLVEYGFARCHLDSLVCEQFVRIAPWFPPPTPATFADQHRMQFAPPPELRGVGHPAPDRLWTISWVADPRWRESVRLVTANESQVLDWGLRFDTMIEFVDLTERGVLASLRLDTPGWGMLSDDEFWLREETADGQLRVVVVRMSLARPTPTLAKQ